MATKRGARDPLLAKGRALYASIRATPEYIEWEKHERTKEFEKIGAFLQIFDAVTGLGTSAIYKMVLDVWRGDADYFSYLKTAVGVLPFGGKVMAVVNQAIEYTEKARKLIDTAKKVVGTAQEVAATVKRAQDAVKNGDPKDLLAQAAKDSGLLNTATNFRMKKLDRQLSFFRDRDEVKKVEGLLGETRLMRAALPTIPKVPGAEE